MSKSTVVEGLLAREGVTYEYIPALTLKDVDLEASMRNQARPAEALVPELVERYTHAMKRGDEFPAIVVYKKGNRYVIMGGNNRMEAARRAKRATLDAYCVKSNVRATLERITWGLNYVEGKSPSAEDALAHAVLLVTQHGMPRKEAAERMGIPKTRIDRKIESEQLTRRLLKVGLPDVKITPALEALASMDSDVLFRAVAGAVIQGKLTVEDARSLREQAVAAGGDAAGLVAVEAFVTARGELAPVARLQRGERNQVGMHLGGLTKVMAHTQVTALGLDAAKLAEYASTCDALAAFFRSGLAVVDSGYSNGDARHAASA